MHALSPGIDILPHADCRRLQFSWGKEPSTCLECCRWWLGVYVELAIGCLGEVSWELTFAVGFLVLHSLKFKSLRVPWGVKVF